MKYFVLVLAWSAWCLVHSALISLSLTDYLRRRFAPAFRYYRIFFNGVSIITLIPVGLYTYSLKTEPLFDWQGALVGIQFLLVVISFFLFVSGARHYDLLQFFGIRQISQGDSCAILSEKCELDSTGILGVTRHPWYVGGMIIIWARDLDVSAIITNLIILTYFIVGAFLEEHKLTIQFDKAYKAYQKQVSMFLPYKWMRSKVQTGR